MLKGLSIPALALALAGCDLMDGDGPPPGAIRAGEDFYLVPGACDRHGYRQYHPWSRRQPVMPVIYYRTRDGGFSHDSSRAEISADCD